MARYERTYAGERRTELVGVCSSPRASGPSWKPPRAAGCRRSAPMPVSCYSAARPPLSRGPGAIPKRKAAVPRAERHRQQPQSDCTAPEHDRRRIGRELRKPMNCSKKRLAGSSL